MRATRCSLGVLATALVLGACSGTDQPILMNLSGSTTGPDEFAILPTRPLEMPASLSDLPQPAPGAANRADPQPMADAVAALGGNPAALERTAIGAGDGALVAHAARFGVSSDIRERLAVEDLEFRRQNQGRLLERLFGVNVYFKSYRVMALDRYAELERWRRAGVRTPAAPPDPSVEY